MDIREVLRESQSALRSARVFVEQYYDYQHPQGNSETLTEVDAALARIESALASLPAEAQGDGAVIDHFPINQETQEFLRERAEYLDRVKNTPSVGNYGASPPAVNAPSDAEDAAKYRALNTPEIHDFLKAVEREALHQRDRWAAEHDAGKADSDWFWLIGFLAGKALHKPEKMLHHIITTAAACLNWHAARVGAHTAMRPGIAAPSPDQKGGGT